jgi:hypothetical protein
MKRNQYRIIQTTTDGRTFSLFGFAGNPAEYNLKEEDLPMFLTPAKLQLAKIFIKRVRPFGGCQIGSLIGENP